jgi:hypothetical protein
MSGTGHEMGMTTTPSCWEWRRPQTSAVMHANVIFAHQRGLPGAAGTCGQANLWGLDIRAAIALHLRAGSRWSSRLERLEREHHDGLRTGTRACQDRRPGLYGNFWIAAAQPSLQQICGDLETVRPRTEEQRRAGRLSVLKRTDPETGPEHPARFGLSDLSRGGACLRSYQSN